MGRSISLAAYRALSRRRYQSPDASDLPPRPEGELVWTHASDLTRLTAMQDLAHRLRSLRPDVTVLITYDMTALKDPIPQAEKPDAWVIPLASDHPMVARSFLAHWRPDICLWMGDQLMVNLVSAAADQAFSMILADVGGSDIQSGRHKWFPTLTRQVVEFFDQIMANSEPAARAVIRLGVTPTKVKVTERLRISAVPPPCSDDDLADVMADLGGRPVWLAAEAQAAEIRPVLSAHRMALRLAHRLLLVLVLDNPKDIDIAKRQLKEMGLRYADWDAGAMIEDAVNVVITGGNDEIGLWYRVAPLAFLAQSLPANARGIAPLAAAALGCAILYGPNVGRYIDSYSRLSSAGAARTVNDGEMLGQALLQLIAPDQAASMALAGWEVATEGADLTDRLIDLISDRLDERRAANARS